MRRASGNGPKDLHELQDREFVAAIREKRESTSVLDCYRMIGELAASLRQQDGWS